MARKEIPIKAEPRTCGSCDSYKPVNPGDDAGYCHLMPPAWVEQDGAGDWARPVVTPADGCRFWLRHLNS